MAIIADTLPLLRTQIKRVALPRNSAESKMGFGNLVFLYTDDYKKSIHLVKETDNCYSDNKYKYFYYNLYYKGSINGRRYNIKRVDVRKKIYEDVLKNTNLTPHPLSNLGSASLRNTYFDMSKYVEIYNVLSSKFIPAKRVDIFWTYFKSVWFSEGAMKFDKRWVLINADLYEKFTGQLKEVISNPIFMLYFTMYKYPGLLTDIDIDFLIYSKNAVLRVNPSKIEKNSYSVFKREIAKIYSKVTPWIDDSEIDIQDTKEVVKATLNEKYNFTGKNNDDTEEVTDLSKEKEKISKTSVEKEKDTIKKEIDKKVDQVISSTIKEVPKEDINSSSTKALVQVKSEIDVEDDTKLAEEMFKVMQQVKVPSKPLSSARDLAMRQRQARLEMNNVTFATLNEMNAAKREIPVSDVSSSIKNINENVKKIKYTNINKDYIENVLPSDLVKTFSSFNGKSLPLYVRSIDKKDTSDVLNYKETYYVEFEDDLKQRHSITVDIPKFFDNKFLYLGGNKKIINRQNFLYPVVKTAPDTVQIVTNYNKLFIRRVGTKTIGSVERIMKLIQNNDTLLNMFTTGNNSSVNKQYITTIEYDEFGKVLNSFKTKNTTILFSQLEASKYAEDNQIEVPENSMFIGVSENNPIFINLESGLSQTEESISDIIVSNLPSDIQVAFNATKATSKLMYSSVTIMSQTIPFIVLLLFWEGISSVFKKLNLKYRFSKVYPKDLKVNEAVIRFRDTYFVYETNLSTSLLLNGLKVLNTEAYDMNDYNTEDPFVSYFVKVYGKTGIMNAIANYYEFTLDPITLEILKDINLPTDLIELCIYANALLSDESYTRENSQLLSRVRSIEIIPAILYNELSRAYLDYKNSAGKKKISIAKDCVIKQILALQTVEDYSTLNPVVELEKDRAITSKGFRGINVDRAYSEEKRSYDPSMIGTIAMSTSPDGNVGINRFLTMEPNITSARGYVKNMENDKKDLKDTNLFSPAEMLYPLGNTRDDSIRIAMAGKQSKHVIPIKDSSPALITNGVDEMIKYELSSDFVVVAEEDGTVVDYDDKSKVLILEYKSGKKKGIELAEKIVKNGGGGFYLSNQLITKYKVGDKFKKNDTIAYHKNFFTDDGVNGIRMNVGAFAKVAIVSSYDTYNDSAMITEKLSEQAETAITFCKPVVVGKNSNIFDIRKIGDHVEIDDPLISFDTSFEDSDINKLLSKLSEENKEVFREGSRNVVKSKFAGKIIDIKMYSTVDVSELSESLQKIVKGYYNTIEHKKQFVMKHDTDYSSNLVKCGIMLNESTGKVEPNIYGVIKGQKVSDGILIEFYIEHGNKLGVGDKLAYFTALKGVVCEVIPKGYEPYSEFHPDEEVSSLINMQAILKRQVPSINLTILGNKVLVELKNKLREIYKK